MKHRWLLGPLAAAALAAFTASSRAARAGEEPKAPAGEVPKCAECHEDEAAQWKASPHSRSMKPEFIAEWERQGRKWECLVCHTSRYERTKKDASPAATSCSPCHSSVAVSSGSEIAYCREGIGCESCHGPVNRDHPEKSRMPVAVGSEACQPCHSLTYAEWRLSSHGQRDVGCMSCHKMHAMDLRKDDPDQQCGSCHTERLEDFAHATHKQRGLHCITCHMPAPVGTHSKIKGTGVRGHSYGVGAETCAGCHRVQVHQSGEIADLQHRVDALMGSKAEETLKELEGLRKETVDLKESKQAERSTFPWIVGASFALGIGLGLALRGSRKRAPEGPAPTGS